RRDQQNREEHQVVEDLVADRFAEHVDRDGADCVHRRASAAGSSSPRRALVASAELTCATKKSSSVWRIGLSDTSCAPAVVRSVSTRSGPGSGGSGGR